MRAVLEILTPQIHRGLNHLDQDRSLRFNFGREIDTMLGWRQQAQSQTFKRLSPSSSSLGWGLVAVMLTCCLSINCENMSLGLLFLTIREPDWYYAGIGIAVL